MAETVAEASEKTFTPSLRRMFRGFVYLSVVSVGGGTAAWARELFVMRERWMTDDEFLQARALAQILPGPNMLNFSVYVGSHFHGALGGLVAFLGLTVIPVTLIMALGILYFQSGEVPAAAEVLSGLAAAAAGASFGTGLSSGKKHFNEPVFVALALAVFVLVGILRWPLVWVALSVTAVAIMIYRPGARKGAGG